MSFIDVILSKLAPYECLGCGDEGELACPKCLASYLVADEECYRCRQLSINSLTCPECFTYSGLYVAQAAVIYKGIAKDIVWRLKSSGAQATAHTMAKCMLARFPTDIDLIIPVPTASMRIRQRGYDQSYLLARQLSRLSGVPWEPCIRRNGEAHQVGANKDRRLKQLETAFSVKNSSLVTGSRIMVVDDVITTGATIEAMTKVLKRAGASRVEALAFARPKLLK